MTRPAPETNRSLEGTVCWLLSGHDPFMGGTREIDERMFENAAGKNILFLPASPVASGQRQYCEKFADYAAGYGLTTRGVILPEINFYTDEPRDAKEPLRRFPSGEALSRGALEEMFRWADYIYFGGGRPEQFLVNFSRFDLHDMVRDAFFARKTLIGYSAGAYYFSEIWWEPHAVTLLLPIGSAPSDEELHRCRLLGFRYANLAELAENNHYVAWTLQQQYGRRFQFEGLSEWGFFKVYFNAERGIGLIPKLFCRVHFETENYEDRSEFYLIKENFGGHCVIRLANPEAYCYRDGLFYESDGRLALSEFTGKPLDLDAFPGLSWVYDHVNDVAPDTLDAILRHIRADGRNRRSAVNFFSIIPELERRTHHVVTDAAGTLLKHADAVQAVKEYLDQGRLQFLYPPHLPPLGGGG